MTSMMHIFNVWIISRHLKNHVLLGIAPGGHFLAPISNVHQSAFVPAHFVCANFSLTQAKAFGTSWNHWHFEKAKEQFLHRCRELFDSGGPSMEREEN